MAIDVLILTNGPGEVATWVKPVVQQLRNHEPGHGQMRLSVMLSPCPHASGGEVDSLKSYPEVDRVQGPADFFRFLLSGKTADGWDWHQRGVVVFLGGDQLYAVWAAKRLGYRTAIYAEWEPRWLNWVDRFGMMQADALEQVAAKYQPKLTVVGDLMADVESAASAELPFMDKASHLIGLMPGSKPDKLRPGVPLSLAIAHRLHSQHADLQFVIPVAPTVTPETLATYADPGQNATVEVMEGPKADLITPEDGLPYLQIKDGPKVWLWTDSPAEPY